VRRSLILAGLTTLVLNLVNFDAGTLPPEGPSSQAALTSLGQEYEDLQLWTAAITATTDTLSPVSTEQARALADQLARLIRPLEDDFENTTAALSTDQLELILPLWERMAFAHAGFVMLQEQATALGSDPTLEPAELHDLAAQLSAVLDFAAEIQRMVLDQLTTPPPTGLRIT
jgi:erythromycin esterase-like protein